LDNFESKLNNKVAILICGHGSRNKLAITEFQELTKSIQKRYPKFIVEFLKNIKDQKIPTVVQNQRDLGLDFHLLDLKTIKEISEN